MGTRVVSTSMKTAPLKGMHKMVAVSADTHNCALLGAVRHNYRHAEKLYVVKGFCEFLFHVIILALSRNPSCNSKHIAICTVVAPGKPKRHCTAFYLAKFWHFRLLRDYRVSGVVVQHLQPLKTRKARVCKLN